MNHIVELFNQGLDYFGTSIYDNMKIDGNYDIMVYCV